MMAALRLLAVWSLRTVGHSFNSNFERKGLRMNNDADLIDATVESPAHDVWGAADTPISISDLAESLPPQLAAVSADAHELGTRLVPAAIGSAGHSYRIAEARLALDTATNTLSQATNEFRRVS